uniref:Autophagy-related protein n=1 Tax=Rhabditophanes sp. KR3021 TaxID=114890 RepID=A0AC35TYZ8_9BILA
MTLLTYKEKYNFETRLKRAISIQLKYPDRMPIIIERAKSDKLLPSLPKSQYLICPEDTAADLLLTIRHHLKLRNEQAIYLIVNGDTIPSASTPLRQLYDTKKDDDNFLYVVYMTESVFG